jgi:hypothetical protein
MDINKLETQAIIDASNESNIEAMKELNELQLGLIGGGIEVSFH